MVKGTVTITNPTGLHLRPAGKLCEEARKFQCSVMLHKDTLQVSAKSLLALLGAKVKYGDEIELICEGEDETEAFRALTELINSGIEV